MSRAAISVGASAVIVFDRQDADDLLAGFRRAQAAMNLGHECDAPTRTVQSGAAFYEHVIMQNRLGSPPRIHGQTVDSQWAAGSYVDEDDVEDFSEFMQQLNEFWLGPCRPLRAEGYALPTEEEAVADAVEDDATQAAWRIVRDDPEIEAVEVGPSGEGVVTTTSGEVYSVGNIGTNTRSTGSSIALGLAVAGSVVLGVWLLFKGKR
jgi:hypothetical protein